MMQEQKFLLQRLDKGAMKVTARPYAYRLSPFDADLQLMSQYLSQAILLEVAVHPKPGLVTRLDNGSHTDMSLMTFMMSSAVLGKAFHCLQDMGMLHTGSLAELFAEIRAYGVLAEQELLRVTKGVNTQRGILFAGGIVSAAAGYALQKGLDRDALVPLVREMTAGLVEKELYHMDHENATAGEKLYHRYGITGIRGEVEKGFPSVMQQGLPSLQYAFSRGVSLNDALLHALLAIMTVAEDSNIIWRTDVGTLKEVQLCARDILAKGSVFTASGRAAITGAAKCFKERRISPGGSADLLSITIGFYLLDNKEFPTDIF